MRTEESVTKPVSAKGSPFIWGITLFNCTLVALSWFTWFGGNAGHVGAADRLFGHLRLVGFRADFVWLVVSTAVLGLSFISFVLQSRREPSAKANSLLCAVDVLAFCLYLFRALTTGILDFG